MLKILLLGKMGRNKIRIWSKSSSYGSCKINDFSNITGLQNGISMFPDFYYKDYFRVLDLTDDKKTRSVLEFKNNRFSTYSRRTHFTPIWYPDFTDYIEEIEIDKGLKNSIDNVKIELKTDNLIEENNIEKSILKVETAEKQLNSIEEKCVKKLENNTKLENFTKKYLIDSFKSKIRELKNI